MAKCYLMVEDLEGVVDDGGLNFQFAADFGRPMGEMPESVEDMSPAEEIIWNFWNVCMGMADPQHKLRMQAEVAGKVVVPDNFDRGGG